ncbi:MAG: NAD-dependent epimerase/dehydratase family protein, partial [Longimicrobiales bacterium]
LRARSVSIQTLLITGVTGFVGSHVAEAVAGRVQTVRALVRPTSRREFVQQHGLEPVAGSLEDGESVRRAVEGADVVVHMAAATRAGSEAEFERVNAQGTRVIVEAVRQSRNPPRRLVYLSSLAAAGPARSGQPVTPDDTPHPLTAYGRTKLAGERICSELSGQCEVVILRPPAVYGPRDRDMFEFFRMAGWGALPVPAGPARRLQLVHAADLARAVVMAATVPGARGVYHIADPRAYEWREVCAMVAQAVGRRARLIRVPAFLISLAGAVSEGAGRLLGRPAIFSRDKARELLAPGWLCETEGARRELGFETAIPLGRGLLETAHWYRAHGWL